MELMNKKELYYDLITKQLFEDTGYVTGEKNIDEKSDNVDSDTSGFIHNGSTAGKRKTWRKISSRTSGQQRISTTFSTISSRDTDSEVVAAEIRNWRPSLILSRRKNSEIDRLKEDLKVKKIL